MKKKTPDKFSIAKRIKSFAFAFRGIFKAFRTEHNLWIQSSIAIVVIIFGFYFQIPSNEWILVIIAIGMVLMAELFNTAIESLVDLVSPEYDEMAGFAKDVAAGAVLVAAIAAAVIGAIIFTPYLLSL